jgi:histidine triad (HIT) family protein
MSTDCVFCKIIKDEKNKSVIYEDDKVLAFMDFRPINDGHTLVIPKKHYENIYEISEEELAYLFKIVKKVAHAIKKAVKAEGITLIQNNGKAAKQVVFHIHVHIIPQYEKTKLTHPRIKVDSSKLDEIAQRIRSFI